MAENNPTESFITPSRRSYVYENSKSSGNKKRVILIILGILILIGLVAVSIVATGGKGEEETNLTPTVTPQATPTEKPTPTLAEEEGEPTPTEKVTPTPGKGTPTPTTTSTTDKASGLDRANLKIIVQNGGGVAGAATKGSNVLEDLGYDVVSTGNADNFDYETTTIQVKSTKKAYLDLLKKDLADEYTVGKATSDYTGTDADAVVIVGKE